MFEQNMETEKLMQSNDATMNVNQTNGIDCTQQKVGDSCEMGNGGVANGELKEENGGNLTKPELVEMSTSTRSVKCCNGLFNHKFKQKNIVKDNQPPVEKMQSNGTAQNGGTKFNFNTIKAKFTTSNGKYHVNGECGEKMVESFDVEKPVKKVKKCKNKETTIEFEDRDPFRINTNAIKYEYLNVFAEPNSGTFSFSPIWSFTNKMYFNLKLYLYRLFAILIGIPCAFVCAIIFALFSVFQIWIFMPLLRMFKTIFGFIREIWFVVIDTVFGPIIQLFLVCRQPQGSCSYRNVGTDSQCQSSVATKSIYDETNLV